MSGASKAASARGLFRATGKVARPVSAELLGDRTARDDGGLPREADDFYPTPPAPTQALLRAERNRLSLAERLWEPAAGDGAMMREMAAMGFACVGSDLVDRGCEAQIGDWFAFSRHTRLSDTVVTNPPFAPCNADPGWVRHGMETLDLDYMALLMPLGWPSALGRAALWRDWRPARVYLMRWRIDWTGQGASPVTNAWFVWDRRKAPGATQLLMLDRPSSAAAGGLFADDPREAGIVGPGRANSPALRPDHEGK